MAVVQNRCKVADVREMLLENSTSTEGLRRDADFEQLRGAMLQYSGLQRARNFLWVFDEHREWLHSIVDVASKVTERSICSKEDALLLLLTLIGDICTNIQAVARALAKLHLLRWGSAPCGGTSPHLGDDAELEQLLQAIHQGIGIWNPAGALLVGLKQTLCPSAVRAQLASLPVNPGLDAQLCSILEQGTKMGMAHPCANMRRVLEEGMGVKDLDSVAGRFNAEVLGAPTFMADVESAGCALLREFYKTTDHKPSSVCAANCLGILMNRHFMASNTGMCAAWMEETRVLEVYKWMRPAENHGVLELVHILRDVRKLPLWRDSLVQEFTIKTGELLSLSQDCQGYEVPKKVSKHDLYVPVKLTSGDAERYVEAALQSSNIGGGCWNTILYGRPPSACLDLEIGFRMAPLCVAVAGMAVWFPGVDYKMAAWVHFPNITLGGGHCLTLGTCDVKVEKSGCTGKRAQKVVFVAGKDSQMWKTNVMFG